MYATTHSVSLQGAVGHVIDVGVDISQGTVATALVGRPDASINESRERCRAAVNNSGYHWPTTRKITILLSPADLPKRGPHFDLAIAVGVLAADAGAPDAAALTGVVLIGELSLDGRVRCVPGVLPMVMAAAARGINRVIVPEPQLAEAALVDGVEVFGVRSLRQVMALLTGTEIPEAPPVEPLTGERLLPGRGAERLEAVDLVDVLGMIDARFALEVAAAGGHHLLLTGAKGAGKTTLAERLPSILPDLDRADSLELTAIHSLCGSLPDGSPVLTRPPLPCAPPHGVTGGHPRWRQRPGSSRRGEQGPPRCALPRRVPVAALRHHRGFAAAVGEWRDHDCAR